MTDYDDYCYDTGTGDYVGQTPGGGYDSDDGNSPRRRNKSRTKSASAKQPESRVCKDCSVTKARIRYGLNQWKKESGSSCKDCMERNVQETPPATRPPPAQTVTPTPVHPSTRKCKTCNADKTKRDCSFNQWKKGSGSLLCKSCATVAQPQQTSVSGSSACPTSPRMTTYRNISIDVECAATGRGHNDREVCSVALVELLPSGKIDTLLHEIVKIDGHIESPLTSLTGLTREQILEGKSKDNVVRSLRQILTRDAAAKVRLIGNNIQCDVDWIGLALNSDYHELVDLGQTFMGYDKKYRNVVMFSLAKLTFALLGYTLHEGSVHNPANDAIASLRLYAFVRNPVKLKQAKMKLDDFHKRRKFPDSMMGGIPDIDKVCMSAFNPKKCSCRQPLKRNL